MGGKSGDAQTSTQSRTIPDFLQGPLQGLTVEGSQISRNQLRNLETLLDREGPALVQPFDPAQEQGQQQTLDLAEAIQSGPLLQAGQGAVLDIARGDEVEQFFPTVADRLTEQQQLPGTTRETLESTAEGDFLFGGDAFNEAVDASIRQAQPQIASTFAGQGGRGAIDSGLAQTAMQQVASDAFARQFGQERARQQQAATDLGNLTMQLQQQNLQGPMALGDILQGERSRQLQAAQLAREQSLLGPQLMQQVGQQRQQQQQRELREPIMQRERLLTRAMDAAQPFRFLGQQQTQPVQEGSPATGALGGALTGAQLGSVVPGLGTTVGAVGGGLLGALG